MSEPAPEMPEGLPELPPVPDGFDRWEYRGKGWKPERDCAYSMLDNGEDLWCVGRRQRPDGHPNLHYLEAVRSQPQPDEVQALFNASPDLDDDVGWREPTPPDAASSDDAPKDKPDLLRMAFINSLPQPLFADTFGAEWPIYDIEVQTGIVRIDVCGKLEVKHISDLRGFRDESGTYYDVDVFYLDYQETIRCCFGNQSRTHHCTKDATKRLKDEPGTVWCDEHAGSMHPDSLEQLTDISKP